MVYKMIGLGLSADVVAFFFYSDSNTYTKVTSIIIAVRNVPEVILLCVKWAGLLSP